MCLKGNDSTFFQSKLSLTVSEYFQLNKQKRNII